MPPPRQYVLTLALLLGLSPVTLAQTRDTLQPGPQREVGTQTEANKPEKEEPQKPWTFEGGIDWVSAYMFRGYNNVDTGYIFQPYLNVTRHFDLTDQFSLDLYGGVWANYAEHTPKTSGPKHFNEFDANLGVTLNYDKWSVGLEYLYYNSPANDFDDVHEVGVLLSYEHWLSPSIGYYREIDDRNGNEDTYLEFKLEPSLPSPPFLKKLELTLPMVLGTSLDGYYFGSDGHNSFFGYAAIGLSASYPIAEHWSLKGGVEYHHLFADNLQDINSDSDYKIVGRIGVAFEY
jgi:hypothetical protein